MKNLLIILFVFLLFSCKQTPLNKDFEIDGYCVVDSIEYKGCRSTIEPEPYWNIITNCGMEIPIKDPNSFKKGDTIVIYVKETKTK